MALRIDDANGAARELLDGGAFDAEPTERERRLERNRSELQRKREREEERIAADCLRLGAWCEANDLPDEARRSYRTGLMLKPDDPRFLDALGMVRLEGIEGYATRIETEHYVIFTTVDGREADSIGEAAEKTYRAFWELLGPYARLTEPQEKLELFFFETEAQYRAYLGAKGISIPHPAGFYTGATGAAYFRKERQGPAALTFPLLHHEATHQLEARVLGRGSPTSNWLVEALARSFESLGLEGGKLEMPGWDYGNWRINGPVVQYFPLREFTSWDNATWTSKRTSMQHGLQKMYNQGLTLFLYFLDAHDGRYREAFLRDVVVTGRSRPEEIERALGVTIEEIEDDYIAFANRIYGTAVSK